MVLGPIVQKERDSTLKPVQALQPVLGETLRIRGPSVRWAAYTAKYPRQ